MTNRAFDIVLYGATGFTGGLTAEYLVQKMLRTPFRFAIAGRNREKLAAVKAHLGAIAPEAKNIGILAADATESASLTAMAAQAQVVITTVGPYIRYGEPLVKACIEAGADYVDLTGEPAFVDLITENYGAAAEAKGVRIVNCCGFDSIPHDLGALFTMRLLNAKLGTKAGEVPVTMEGFVRARGNFSGGTWHSAIGAMGDFRTHAKRRKTRRRPPQSDGRKVGSVPARIKHRKDLGGWAIPMPTIDPEVIRRTATAYTEFGPSFKYGHNMLIKRTATAAAFGVGAGAVFTLAQFKPTRDLLLKVRDPGVGPSAEERAKGRFTVTMVAEGGGEHVIGEVHGGDPGYGDTAKMLAESALCLALDRAKLPDFKGIITPAMAMGQALIDRLQPAGIKFSVPRQQIAKL